MFNTMKYWNWSKRIQFWTRFSQTSFLKTNRLWRGIIHHLPFLPYSRQLLNLQLYFSPATTVTTTNLSFQQSLLPKTVLLIPVSNPNHLDLTSISVINNPAGWRMFHHLTINPSKTSLLWMRSSRSWGTIHPSSPACKALKISERLPHTATAGRWSPSWEKWWPAERTGNIFNGFFHRGFVATQRSWYWKDQRSLTR